MKPPNREDAISLAAARAALENKKLTIHWDGSRPSKLTDEVLLPPLWQLLRSWHPDPPGTSQDERVTLRIVESCPGSFKVHYRAVFDHDFCSQYDRTEEYDGELFIENKDPII